MKLVNVVIFAICAILIVGCSALSPENKEGNRSAAFLMEETVTLRNARICDPTGCYFAWRVVDSDGDGVSDADELMAGTDPYDPKSRPSLVVVAELGGKQQLPSFEAGLGAFTIFPAELLAMVEESKNDPLAAFPLAGERADTLSRLGISAELLKQHNIDLTNQGFTVGPITKSSDSGMFEPRIGGVELRLISADDPAPLDPNVGNHGDETYNDVDADGNRTIGYEDGATRIEWSNGDITVLDKDGNVVGTAYVNPDADPVSDAPTPEQEAAFKRLRGAATLTLENWSAPDNGTEPSDDPRATIILVDPEYAYETAMISDAPRVSGAQPEVRDDLPNPGVAAGDPEPEVIPGDPGVTSP
jgi:hypothetical protein